MAILSDALDADVTDMAQLREALHQTKSEGFITGSQCDAIAELAEPYLPCRVMLHMRTKKGAVYVTLANDKAHAFIIDHRAKLK